MGDKTGIAWTDATWNPVTSLDREWASIPGFPAYAVNREGTIVSFYVSADSLDGWVVAGAVEPERPDPGYVIPGVVNGRKAAA